MVLGWALAACVDEKTEAGDTGAATTDVCDDEIREGAGVLFVAPGGTGAGSADAPFGSLQAAIDAAVDGGTLVIDQGTYNENLTIGRNITLVGRCPGLGIVQGSGGPAVLLTGSATLQSLKITGDGVGIRVEGGALDAHDVTVEATGGTAIRAVGGSVLLANSSVVEAGADGLAVDEGATAVITDSELSYNAGFGIYATGADTHVELSDTRVNSSERGGLAVEEGAAIAGFRVEIHDNVGVNAVAFGFGSSILVNDTWLETPVRAEFPWLGLIAVAAYGGRVELVGGAVRHPTGPAVGAYLGGSFACNGCSLTDGLYAGAIVAGGTLELTNALVDGTILDPELGGGIGVYATNLVGESTVILTDTVLDVSNYAPLWLDGNGRFQLTNSTLFGGVGPSFDGWPTHGNAIFAENGVTAWDGTRGLEVSGCTLQNAQLVGVLLHDSTGTFSGNTWSNNTIDIVQQHCTTTEVLEDTDNAATAELCTGPDRLIDASVDIDPRLIPSEDALGMTGE